MKAHLVSIVAVFLVILFTVQAQTSKEQTPETLAKESNCFECHKNSDNDIRKVVGPTFYDIAMKYKNDSLANITLFKTIKNGGRGNWGKISRGISMPPHSGRLSDAEIRNLVVWVLDH